MGCVENSEEITSVDKDEFALSSLFFLSAFLSAVSRVYMHLKCAIHRKTLIQSLPPSPLLPFISRPFCVYYPKKKKKRRKYWRKKKMKRRKKSYIVKCSTKLKGFIDYLRVDFTIYLIGLRNSSIKNDSFKRDGQMICMKACVNRPMSLP